MDKQVSFLLSGPGLIGRRHAKLIDERPDLRLTAVVGPQTVQNSDFAQAHNATLYPDVETAVRQEKIDGAIISSPNEFHHAQAVTCLENGIPALVEKPLTDEIETARHLAELSERAGIPLLVGHHRTYSPLLKTAAKFLRSDGFGNLVSMQGSAQFFKPSQYFDDGPWRAKKGGGPILINLIHEIGIMRHLCGEISSVSAIVSNARRGFEVEDSAAVVLTFASGAIGSFVLSDTAASSKSWEMTAGEDRSYPFFPDQNCYHFAGDQGSLDFPSMQIRTYSGTPDRSWWNAFAEHRLDVERQNPLSLQLDHFTEVIRTGTTPVVTARDGYLNLLVLAAIRQSAATRTVVDMDNFGVNLAKEFDISTQ